MSSTTASTAPRFGERGPRPACSPDREPSRLDFRRADADDRPGSPDGDRPGSRLIVVVPALVVPLLALVVPVLALVVPLLALVVLVLALVVPLLALVVPVLALGVHVLAWVVPALALGVRVLAWV